MMQSNDNKALSAELSDSMHAAAVLLSRLNKTQKLFESQRGIVTIAFARLVKLLKCINFELWLLQICMKTKPASLRSRKTTGKRHLKNRSADLKKAGQGSKEINGGKSTSKEARA